MKRHYEGTTEGPIDVEVLLNEITVISECGFQFDILPTFFTEIIRVVVSFSHVMLTSNDNHTEP